MSHLYTAFALAGVLTAIFAVGGLLAVALGHGVAFATLSMVTFGSFGVTAALGLALCVKGGRS